jgi:hypothetical protein
MKKLFALIFCLTLFWNTNIAQTPLAFKYQAVVRTNLGQIIVNQQVGFRISILKTSITGTSVYSEKQTATTNTFGLVTFEIGRGTVVLRYVCLHQLGKRCLFCKDRTRCQQ